MDTKVKEKWLAALRSGEYKQGKGRLHRLDDTYCCLGVLCDIHAKETGNEWIKDELNAECYNYITSTALLPTEVYNWAGLNSYCSAIKERSLIAFNDNGRHTFNQIADLIEENL